LIFGEYSVLWLEKKKIGESLKCNLEKKTQIMGKIAKVSGLQNWKKNNTVANTSTTVFFFRKFSHCGYKTNSKFGDSCFSWCKFEKKAPKLKKNS
jgi:hypothetical protein